MSAPTPPAARPESTCTPWTRLVLSQPVIPPLRDLKAEELDILQLAHNYGHLETVLNKSLSTDLDTVQFILKLIKGAYLRPE